MRPLHLVPVGDAGTPVACMDPVGPSRLAMRRKRATSGAAVINALQLHLYQSMTSLAFVAELRDST